MEVGRSSSLMTERVDQANVHSITASIKPMFDNFPQSWSDEEEREDSLVHSVTALIEPIFDNVLFDYFRQSSSYYFIPRVPERLRSVKPEAYTPLIVSIGPFHHGDPRLKTMERLKTQYLYSLLRRHPKISLDRYVKELLKLETRARNCYAETIPQEKAEFVKMLLLDGCFLLELFRKYWTPNKDQLFTNRWIFNAVLRDVLLLENQIPFFVLETLFSIITGTELRENSDLCHLIQLFLGPHKLLGDRDWHIRSLEEEPLLLSVLYSITDSQSDREETTPKSQTTIAQLHSKFLRVCCPFKKIILRVCRPFKKNNPTNRLPIQKKKSYETFIPSATELSRVGIKFVDSRSSNLFDVRLGEKGVFHMPFLVVDDSTESFLRNLIALEQTHSKTTISGRKYQKQSLINDKPTISAYVTLMDCLVNTCADVALLRDQGILYNHLGDDKEVAQLFNKLRTGIIMNPYEFCFSEVFKSVNVYYHTKWNEWRAMFFREFWSTPWRKTSLLAAIFLLLFTFVQTVCSILQVLPHWSK